MLKGVRVIEYDTIGSTNAEAKKYARTATLHEPALFIARSQSEGRGRMGRSFFCRDGRGIYMSLLYFTDSPLCDAVLVTTAAAVFAAESIERVTGGKMRIKWVNDIYNERGKVAGILCETVMLGDITAVTVGMGINTGVAEFPEELCGIASSIGEINGEERNEIIEDIVNKLISHAKRLGDRSYMKGYRERFMLDGARVELRSAGESIALGRVLGVTDDGGLIFLPDGDGTPKTIRSGEISLIPLY